MTEIIFSSSYDDKFPPQNIFVSGNKQFWTSTGLFPQEILVQLDITKSVSSINISSYAIKSIYVESCENDSAITFTKQAQMIDIPYSEGKLQEFNLNFQSAGNKIKLIKLNVTECYDTFCTINNIIMK